MSWEWRSFAFLVLWSCVILLRQEMVMTGWEKFKEDFERVLRITTGPDGSCDGPQSCLECVVCFVGIIVLCVIIALLKA